MDSKTSCSPYSGGIISAHLNKNILSAEELISSGERLLLEGHLAKAQEDFSKAESILGEVHPALYYRQGLSLFEFGSDEGHEQALLMASKKFRKGHQLDPYCFDLLVAWGNTLALLGERMEQHHFYLEAKDKYEKALGLSQDSADLFWDYGVVWYHIGHQSGEPCDLQNGLKAFERAAELSDTLSSEFWIDYGAIVLLLANKRYDVRLIVKAVHCFKKAASMNDGCYDSWCSLAEALQKLYEHTHEEDLFHQANECFAKAAKLAPQESELWLEWAQFYLDSAIYTSDIKRLRSCLEKCHRAYACDGENGLILAIWGHALALLGMLTERLDLLYEAENKIQSALELSEDDPRVWHSFGVCLSSTGVYYKDPDYFFQAIEKFQTGLAVDRTADFLWHEMGKTYLDVGLLKDDFELLEQSLKFLEKALTLAPSTRRHVDYARALSKLGELSGEKKWLESARYHFEMAISWQKNAIYLHPDWLFSYAVTLDLLGDCYEEEQYYTQAIELLSHVLMVDPDFPRLHHKLAQVLCHLGELVGTVDYFYRAVHHLRLNLRQEEENDQVILDWGIALIHIAQTTPVLTDIEPLMQEAEQKLTLAATLGNTLAYYHLSCLYSIFGQYEKAMVFLRKAAQFQALPPLEELFADEWLDDLRATSLFQEFLTHNPNLQEDG